MLFRLHRLLVIAAAFSSSEAFKLPPQCPAVRRVAAVSPVVPTVMMAIDDSDNSGSLSQEQMMTMLSLAPFPVGALPEELFAEQRLFKTDDDPGGGGTENSIEISSGGLGAVQGATFTVTGYSKTKITLKFHATAISQDDMKKMNAFMQNRLDASKYESYKTHAEASASGSWSLFGGPKASASAKATHDAMSGYGLTEAEQKEALELLAGLLPKPSTFTYDTVIENPTPFAQSGQMYIYSFTGAITVDNKQYSKQMIGGPVARSSSGESLPTKTPFSAASLTVPNKLSLNLSGPSLQASYTIERKDKDKKDPDPFDSKVENSVFHAWEDAVLGGTNPIVAARDLPGDTDFKKLNGKPPTYQFRVSGTGRVRFQVNDANKICTVTYASSQHPKLLADACE